MSPHDNEDDGVKTDLDLDYEDDAAKAGIPSDRADEVYEAKDVAFEAQDADGPFEAAEDPMEFVEAPADADEPLHAEAEEPSDQKTFEERVDGYMEMQHDDSNIGTPATEEVAEEDADEEIDDVEEKSTSETPDAAVIIFHGENIDDILEAIRAREKVVGGNRALIAQIDSDELGFDAILINQASPPAEATATQDRIRAALDAGEKLDLKLVDARTGRAILGAMSRKFKAPPTDQRLSPRDAANLYRQAQRGGRRRIPLYNSGMYIDIVSPSKSQLNSFIDRCNQEVTELGRTFGALFSTHMDHYLREAAFRLFSPLITDASVYGWEKSETLMSAIRIEDYDVILMSIAAMMYPEGWPDFRHSCLNTTECNHETVTVADLNKMIYHNFSRLSPAAIEHMRAAADKKMTMSELVEYQRMLPFVEADIEDPKSANLIRHGRHGVVMQSPSFLTFLGAGRRFIDNVMTNLVTDDQDAVQRAVTFRAFRQLAPWISELRSYATEDSPDSEPEFVVTEPLAIEELLDDLHATQGATQLYENILNMIDRHKISHICFPVFECPKCGHVPQTKSGFFTVEPMETFFMMCAQKLISES